MCSPRLLARYPVRFIYTMPTFHNPTGATMPLERRRALLAVAGRQSTPIVEDNLFDQLYYDQPPPPSLKALDRDGLVLALGSASKIIGAGLRLGWLVAPPQTIEQVARLKRASDLQTNNLAQVGVQRFLAAGLLDAQLAELRRHCQHRLDRLVDGVALAVAGASMSPRRAAACRSGCACPRASGPRRCWKRHWRGACRSCRAVGSR